MIKMSGPAGGTATQSYILLFYRGRACAVRQRVAWRENKIRGSECLDVKEESLRGEERGKRRGRESEQEGEKEERNIRERREAPRKAAGEHESFFGEHEDKKRGP